jgi:hypothetical protein
MVGMLMTGIFASKGVNAAGNDGLFYGNPAFFFTQLKAMLIVVAYSFTVSFLIFKFISIIMPLRVTEEDEEFQRLEREAKMRALEDDDTQVYKKPWVGLTEEERLEIRKRKWWDWEDAFDIDGFMQAIETKLKEKNT